MATQISNRHREMQPQEYGSGVHNAFGSTTQYLCPVAPYVWPEPRSLAGQRGYDRYPPFESLVETAGTMHGIVCALNDAGLDLLEAWFARNSNLKLRLIVAVYPTCITTAQDLLRMRTLNDAHNDRLELRLYALQSVTDRAANALCFVESQAEIAHFAIGASNNFGFDPDGDGKLNFVFRAEAALVEAFSRYFNWIWVQSKSITADGVTQIPKVVLPEGSAEAARQWAEFVARCSISPDVENEEAKVDPETGKVTIVSPSGQEIDSPTESIGVPELDTLAEAVARLYEKGMLISVDKLTRIPPLDAPLDPRLFGDVSELHKGNVTRKVSMRVSVIDAATLKEIEKCRTAFRSLLTKFTYGLADNMRWMPRAAMALFEAELERINAEGQALVATLIKGDVKGFLAARRDALVADINAMYQELDRKGKVTDDILSRVESDIAGRLTKAQSANFLPRLTYSTVAFHAQTGQWASPWGQAFALLLEIAQYPRKALTDPFFFRGIRVAEDRLLESMNVADDTLLGERDSRSIRDRCKSELSQLTRIKDAPWGSRDKCDVVWKLIRGVSLEPIENALLEKEAKAIG